MIEAPAHISPGELDRIAADYERDGVARVRGLFAPAEVASLQAELARYQREDLPGKPADACTREADGRTVRNLWRLERHHPELRQRVERADIVTLAGRLTGGPPVLAAVETFNKPARVGSAVPYHQDNAYFCQSPPDMLTIWIAIDPVTLENGPVYYLKGSHRLGTLPAVPSGVPGNSMGLAEPPVAAPADWFCGLLSPGDALIHHCQTIHRSEPNLSDHPRLGLLLVYRGAHTRTDATLQAAYAAAGG